MEEKKEIRKKIFKARKEHTDAWIRENSLRITEALTQLPEYRNAERIMVSVFLVPASKAFSPETVCSFCLSEETIFSFEAFSLLPFSAPTPTDAPTATIIAAVMMARRFLRSFSWRFLRRFNTSFRHSSYSGVPISGRVPPGFFSFI